ncbi:MAG: hypothetical protein IT371_30295 [Deltaproteobacteria bacterium]|nr:hypothetical protein [Deltaproteobacteria bacterium]
MKIVIRNARDDRPTLSEVAAYLGLASGEAEIDLTITEGCEAQVFTLARPVGPRGPLPENEGAGLLLNCLVRGPAGALFGPARGDFAPLPPAGGRARLTVVVGPTGDVTEKCRTA